MAEQEIELALTVDAGDAEQAKDVLRQAGADVEGSPTRGIDGSQTEQWMVLASAAITTAPALIAELRKFVSRNKVGSLTLGELTIENPTPDDVERAWASVRGDR